MYLSQPVPRVNEELLLQELRESFDVRDLEIDIEEFRDFLKYHPYPESYKLLFKDYLTEKLLEHFISLKLLSLQAGDVLVDIAADKSYFADYVFMNYGIEAYKQDLSYKPGIFSAPFVPHIGGNATNLPFRDGYVSKMTLHCSLEHFEGSSDTQFIQEARRVLKPSGQVCILPLYLGNDYYFVTDPTQYSDQIPFDGKVYAMPGYNNRHCRIYSVNQWQERVAEPSGMSLVLYYISNLREIAPHLHEKSLLYCSLAAVFKK